jgi:hypothetical protein
MQTTTYNTPIEEATSYTLTLNPELGEVNVSAGAPEGTLMDANLNHFGTVSYNVTGASDKFITLRESNSPNAVTWLPSFLYDVSGQDHGWRIRLNPTVPLTLEANNGFGESNYDLSGLTLASANLNNGAGDITVTLPPAETQSYDVNISNGVGSTHVNLPSEAAVRMTISNGLGDINVSGLREVGDSDGERVFESANYDSAEQRITINISNGLGSVTVR